MPIARALLGIRSLKIITFGPRPQDFFACNAPIKGLYELGVEVEENSELDLLVSYKAHANDPRIPEVCADMAKEMGEGRYYADMNERMAQPRRTEAAASMSHLQTSAGLLSQRLSDLSPAMSTQDSPAEVFQWPVRWIYMER